MKKGALIIVGILLCIDIGFWVYHYYQVWRGQVTSPVSRVLGKQEDENLLEQYSFPNLQERTPQPGIVEIVELINDQDSFSAYLVTFKTGEKKVSGVLHLPDENQQEAPLIIMFRGYVDPSIYYSGLGTSRYAEYLSSRGFVTLAPDFLNYGDSDLASEVPLEGRFETYTTALDLLASVPALNNALSDLSKEELDKNIQVDPEQVGLWGHSNGGHISLSMLAITGKNYPTVLWNPVSKHFPYSVLFYTDEFEDQGKYLRKVVADFEEQYNIDEFSPPNYYNGIAAPIQLHQGSADLILPQKWSDEVVAALKEKEVDIEYVVHQGGDHNLAGGSAWADAAQQGVAFYRERFGRK